MRATILACVTAAALGIASGAAVQAQPSPLKRVILQTFDVPGSNYQTVIGTSALGANEHSGRQSHPGPEGGYVLEGSGTILVDGKPPLQLKAGQSYQLAPGVVHDVTGGAAGVKLLVTWDVEKGKPFATPAK